MTFYIIIIVRERGEEEATRGILVIEVIIALLVIVVIIAILGIVVIIAILGIVVIIAILVLTGGRGGPRSGPRE